MIFRVSGLFQHELSPGFFFILYLKTLAITWGIFSEREIASHPSIYLINSAKGLTICFANMAHHFYPKLPNGLYRLIGYYPYS